MRISRYLPLILMFCVAGCRSPGTGATVKHPLPEVVAAILQSCRPESGYDVRRSNIFGAGAAGSIVTNEVRGVSFTLTLGENPATLPWREPRQIRVGGTSDVFTVDSWPQYITTKISARAVSSAESKVHVRCDGYSGCIQLAISHERCRDLEMRRLTSIVKMLTNQP